MISLPRDKTLSIFFPIRNCSYQTILLKKRLLSILISGLRKSHTLLGGLSDLRGGYLVWLNRLTIRDCVLRPLLDGNSVYFQRFSDFATVC